MRERAHALREREGRPEGGAERHRAQAEPELRSGAQGRAAAAADAASTAGTETWTGPTAASGEGRNRWEKGSAGHRSGRDQTDMAPDDLASNDV